MIKEEKVSFEIEDSEIFIRGIIEPIQYKNNNLTKSAILPRAGDNDVSMLRLRYCDYNFCKKYTKDLSYFLNANAKPDNSNKFVYKGLAALKISELLTEGLSNRQNKYFVIARATPLKENKECYSHTDNVTTSSEGYPMHCDIYYNITPNAREPLPVEFKKLLDKLLNKILELIVFKIDNYPDLEEWK